jgi:hypothetical protein
METGGLTRAERQYEQAGMQKDCLGLGCKQRATVLRTQIQDLPLQPGTIQTRLLYLARQPPRPQVYIASLLLLCEAVDHFERGS